MPGHATTFRQACYISTWRASEGLVSIMEPSNEHEREIARLFDERALSQGTLDYAAVPAVTAQLKFMMTRSDSAFLIAYLHWRMNNPIQKAGGAHGV